MEQKIYDLLKSLEGENYHLKNQLIHKNKSIKAYKRLIASLKVELEDKKKKQFYRNGQKRGGNNHGRNG